MPSFSTIMMASQSSTSLVSGAIGFILILLCTIPAVSNLLSTLFTPRNYALPKVYEDKDGEATEESMLRFSAKIPKAIVVTLSVLGLVVSTVLGTLGTLRLAKDGLFIENWINCASWVSIPSTTKQNKTYTDAKAKGLTRASSHCYC
jgi:hypothetical protein